MALSSSAAAVWGELSKLRAQARVFVMAAVAVSFVSPGGPVLLRK